MTLPLESPPVADAAGFMNRMYRHQRHIYDLTRKFYLLGRDELVAALAPPERGRVLEIGCGTGRNLIKAARAYPSIQAYGVDVSTEMLATACQSVTAAGLAARISTAQADATSFDPRECFGVASFDRIFISYALSMIPPWRDVVAHACHFLAENGSLHIVDFGDQAGLPGWFRIALDRWLALFSVHPCLELEADLAAFAGSHGMSCRFERLYRGYAFYAVLAVAEGPAAVRGVSARNA